MDKWRDIKKDPPPKDGTRILVATAGGKMAVVRCVFGFWTLYYRPADSWLQWLRGRSDWLVMSGEIHPTHWQPITPPQEPTHG